MNIHQGLQIGSSLSCAFLGFWASSSPPLMALSHGEHTLGGKEEDLSCGTPRQQPHYNEGSGRALRGFIPQPLHIPKMKSLDSPAC